jgi:sulfite exporter TauE/SafE
MKLFSLKNRGRLIENIGLGIFVNGSYGISDGSIESFNLIDIILGIVLIIIGLYLQEKGTKWEDG